MQFAQLIGVQRAQLLAELNRRSFDRPSMTRTSYAAWDDMVVVFVSESDICNAEVVVNDDIDIVMLTSRLQVLLQYARGPSASQITYKTSIKKYGSVAKARHVLCDEIVRRTKDTTVGRMKPLASGLKAGMIMVTIEDYRDVVTFECSNSSRGRLLGAWTAICIRLEELQKSREPRPEDLKGGFLILRDESTGLWLVRNESWTLGQPPALLLYAEDKDFQGAFFNGAGEYPEEDHEVSVADVVPIAREIIRRRIIDLAES
jgi:hypothetical protein